MHEHKGTNLAKRDSTRILTTKTMKSQFFWVVVLTLILSWRSVIMPPEILEAGNLKKTQRLNGGKTAERQHELLKAMVFFLSSEKGNLEFGTEIECYFLVI